MFTRSNNISRLLLPFLLSCFFANSTSGQSPASYPGLTITHLTGNFYIFITAQKLDDGPYPANGMYLVTSKGVVMFDSPWDTTQAQPLLDSIYRRHYKKVVLFIATHFHNDRTNAIDFLKRKGVATWCSAQTYELCLKNKKPLASHIFIQDTVFRVGGYSFSTFYPGAGHTSDNIVIWFDKDKVLYGGCFIKSTEVNDLGFLDDANLAAWPLSVQMVIDRFPDPAFVIPGHFGWSDPGSLQHTLDLLRAHK